MRVIYSAKLVEHFVEGDCIHEFTGEVDDGGEWITPAEALKGIGLSIWNAVEGMSENVADRFELGLGLAFVESRAREPEAVTPLKERDQSVA